MKSKLCPNIAKPWEHRCLGCHRHVIISVNFVKCSSLAIKSLYSLWAFSNIAKIIIGFAFPKKLFLWRNPHILFKQFVHLKRPVFLIYLHVFYLILQSLLLKSNPTKFTLKLLLLLENAWNLCVTFLNLQSCQKIHRNPKSLRNKPEEKSDL